MYGTILWPLILLAEGFIMLLCKQCNGKNEDNFDACWNCGTPINGIFSKDTDEFKRIERELYVSNEKVNTNGIKFVASGQKFIIYSILGNFLGMVLMVASYPALGLLCLSVCCLLSLVGMFQMASGLGYSEVIKILLVILMFAPGIGLCISLILNSRATKALISAGYKIGLLGASAP